MSGFISRHRTLNASLRDWDMTKTSCKEDNVAFANSAGGRKNTTKDPVPTPNPLVPGPELTPAPTPTPTPSPSLFLCNGVLTTVARRCSHPAQCRRSGANERRAQLGLVVRNSRPFRPVIGWTCRLEVSASAWRNLLAGSETGCPGNGAGTLPLFEWATVRRLWNDGGARAAGVAAIGGQ